MMSDRWKKIKYLVNLAILFFATPILGQIEFDEHLVTNDFGQGISVFPVDIDGDDDIDLLGAARENDEIIWFENDGEQEFARRVISNEFRGAEDVCGIDLDQDGDIDIVGAALNHDRIAWWENNGDQEFEERIIVDGFSSAASVSAADIDGDGDIDVIAGGIDGLSWWENDGDQEFEGHLMLGNFGNAYDFYVADIDGDDDLDVVAISYSNDTVSWVENEGDGDFREHVIDNQCDGGLAVHAADLDDDGDMDIISGAYRDCTVIWYENDGDQGFDHHILGEQLGRIWDVFVADLNDNNLPDIMYSSYGASVICWFDNEGDGDFEMYRIVEDFEGATGIYAVDIDGDSDLDVVGTGYGEGTVKWWENLRPNFRLIVEPDTFNLGPVAIEIERVMNLQVIHRTENVNGEDVTVELEVEEGEEWLQIEPLEAVLAPDDTLDVEVSVLVRDDEELGVHEGLITIIPNDLPRRTVEIPVMLFAVEGFGSLSGVIIDAATQEALPGVCVELEGLPLQVDTDDEGVYLFENLPAWPYCVVVELDSFLPYRSEEFEVGVDQDVELNIELLHALCELDIDSISVEMVPDSIAVIEFSLFNAGTGSLRFWVERRFPVIGDAEPWDLRTTIDAADQTGDNRLQGVEFDGNHFYVTGGNNGEGCGLIHVFSTDGEHVGSFDQFHDSQWGMRDLAWDGELLWGGDGEIIYGFTPEGELREQFAGPLEINRAMTWDEEHGRLWVCDVSTDIYGLDRSGNLLDRIELDSELHIYGLGTFPEDSAGYTIYSFSKDGEYDTQINRINPDDGDHQLVADLETQDELKAGGSCITDHWNPMSWVLVGVLQGRDMVTDEIGIWFINPNYVWLVSEPDSGIVAPDGSVVVDVTINSEGFAIADQLSGELVITHNGRGDQFTVPVTLQVVREDAVEPSSEALRLPTVCTLVDPYPNPFNSSAIINYSIPSPQLVSLSVWDIGGRKVATLVDGLHNAGTHRILWEGSLLSAGTYIVRMEAGESILNAKVVHIK